jgi:integrase
MARRKKDNEFSMVNGVRKTKSGSWEAAVYVGTSAELDKHGKPKKLYEWITCDTEKECRLKKRDLETEIENRSHSSYGDWQFDVWCDKWMEVNFVDYSQPNILDKVKPKYKPSTQVSYEMYIETHFKKFFGKKKLKDISEMNIKEYIAKKIKGSPECKALSSTTIAKHFYVLSDILYDALKIKNPCRDIEPPEIKKYKPIILDENGFNLILDALRNTWDEIPLLLSAWCGLRQGEIFCLKWDDIDKENCLITIDENRAISEFGYMDVDPKSERGIRTIPVAKKIIDLLESHRLKQKKISQYVFEMRPDSYSGRFGKLIDRHNKALKDLKGGKVKRSDFILKGHKRSVEFNLAKAPLPDIRFHDLRHYHATILYKNGISDQYAAERLGHDIKVLKSIYQHLEDSTKRKEDDKVKEIFG